MSMMNKLGEYFPSEDKSNFDTFLKSGTYKTFKSRDVSEDRMANIYAVWRAAMTEGEDAEYKPFLKDVLYDLSYEDDFDYYLEHDIDVEGISRSVHSLFESYKDRAETKKKYGEFW